MPSEARIRGAGDRDPTHPPAHHQRRSAGSGIAHAWSTLDRDRRLSAVAAVALFATMFLPWYQQNAVVSAAKTAPLVSRNLNAFAVFSFVEAAVLLVAVAVLFLLYARAEKGKFQLPGGDGTVVLAAGLWSALLLVLRLFDKPGVIQHGVAANVGVQWGIFFALAAAGLLAYAGSRMRAAQRPEPPLVRRSTRPYPEPPEPEAQETVVISRREGAPRSGGRAPRVGGSPVPKRERYPPAPGEEQLSFEDQPDLPL